jgi:DNA damage-inducible protein 1
VLRIQDEEVDFLPEHELPSNARSPVGEVPKESPSIVTNIPKPQDVTKPQVEKKQVVDEIKVKGLTDIGIGREEAIAALEACGGDVDVAAGMLLG